MANASCQRTIALLKVILRITSARARILSENLACAHLDQFTPQDLPVGRLVDRLEALTDGDQMALVAQLTSMVCEPDNYAGQLLKLDRERYIRYQQEKLLENYLNERIARRMLYHCTGHKQPDQPADRFSTYHRLEWRHDG